MWGCKRGCKMGVHFLFLLHEEFLSDMFDILCTGPNRSDITYDRLNILKLLHLSSSKIIKINIIQNIIILNLTKDNYKLFLTYLLPKSDYLQHSIYCCCRKKENNLIYVPEFINKLL